MSGKSGMEMMMASLLKVMGFDPEEVKSSMISVVTDLQNGLAKVASLLDEIRNEQRIINARIERLEKMNEAMAAKMGIHSANGLDLIEDYSDAKL